MSSSIPVVRQVNWLSAAPHMLLMGLLIAGFYKLGSKDYFFHGALTYLGVSLTLRNLVARHHNQGIRLVKKSLFTEAILCFEKSYQFFNRYRWIDKYRFITLLSSSRMSYSEMALCNMAFCYGQSGSRQQAVDYYEQALREHPESGLAKAGLNMLRAV